MIIRNDVTREEDRTMPLWFRVLRLWIPGTLVLTVTCGFAYGAVQQLYRTGADDPQVQMARDVAAKLKDGYSSSNVVPRGEVDIATSLAPFVIVYDIANKPRSWSGTLDGEPPVPPVGVLDAARRRGENRVTWQPRPDVRIATVVVAVDAPRSRVVLAGRSLRETEERIASLGYMVIAAWGVGIVGLFAAVLGFELSRRRLERPDASAA
jgi:hypothetical protein